MQCGSIYARTSRRPRARGPGQRARAHHGREAAARREEIKRYPEVLLQIADDEADGAKDDDEDLEEAFAVVLAFEVHGERAAGGDADDDDLHAAQS